jgi:hypothetical protein
VEWLKVKVLSSNPSTTKKKKKIILFVSILNFSPWFKMSAEAHFIVTAPVSFFSLIASCALLLK